MAFRIIRDDIARVRADAIVNSANPNPVVGGGAEAAIYEAAGPGLLRARDRFGRLEPGAAVATKAYGLHARYVIHTVGPVWRDGKSGEIETLHRCYRNAICTAISMGCKSAAFPLISSGHYGFAKAEALRAALWEFQSFAEEDIELILVVYDREAYELSEGRFSGIAAYIDDNYVDAHPPLGNRGESMRLADLSDTMALPRIAPRMPDESLQSCSIEYEAVAPECAAAPAAAAAPSLEERMAALDAGFSESLIKLIDESGCTDAEIYKRANVSRKLFSKIRNSPDYRPSKPTALAFCVALRLNPTQARELIGRAGYALSHSSRFDVIVEYFLEAGKYDILEINEALFLFDQPLLGSV